MAGLLVNLFERLFEALGRANTLTITSSEDDYAINLLPPF